MIDSVPLFIQVVRRSRLLGPAELNELKGAMLDEAPDPPGLADRLVARGWLTPYEAEQLLQGQDQDLVLPPYRLMQLVGEGGLCQVFKAWNTRSKTVVALKVVHPELRSNEEVLRQLEQEFQVLARLNHPCFVKAYDIEANTGRHYFAMEYVEGMDLSRLLERAGPLPVAQACAYVRQAAFGLQYVFEKGLVHRDIKPANLLAPRRGSQVRILDIGLVRQEWSAPDSTHDGIGSGPGPALMGTPDYIAPEQALAPDRADVRSDIYSLGCTLFYLLTGHPPFPVKSLKAKLLQHQQAPPPSARSARREISPGLEAVLQKMMAKAPKDRYQIPASVAVALAPFCCGAEPLLDLEPFWAEAGCAGSERSHAGPCPEKRPGGPIDLNYQALTVTAAAPNSLTPSPPERRKSPRRAGNPVSISVLAPLVGPEPIPGWVIDRSSGGLGLLVDEPLEIGTAVDVRPNGGGGGPVLVPVRVVSCVPNGSSWRVGCMFLRTPSWEELRRFG